MEFVRDYDTTTTCWINTQKYDISKTLSLNVFIFFCINYVLYLTTRLSLNQVDNSFLSLLLTQKLNRCSRSYILLAFMICT